VAGTHSGVGKTTVATGLMAAFRRRGRRVGAAKVGPDYIDPGYHALATGRPSHTLDAWMCGEEVIAPLAAGAGAGCDLLVVEGVMGLFDGAGAGAFASSAHVARLLHAPVILVVDASAMSGSVAAIVHGFATFDPTLDVAGVVLNQVAGDNHEALLRGALADGGIPVVGALRRDPALQWRDRHLGLVPVVESLPELTASVERLAVAIEAGCDVDLLHRIAAGAAPLTTEPIPTRAPVTARRPRIALAGGAAFSFNYPENITLLEQAGAELVPFDPLHDAALPDRVDGLIAGGGFPEVYAPHLAANQTLLRDVRRRVNDGLVTWAECGGLLWLASSLDGHPMAGAIPCRATMTDRLTLGYRAATTTRACPLGPAGLVFRGHEFHYSQTDPAGAALRLEGRMGVSHGGHSGPTLLASYVHVHLAGMPELAEAFVSACADGAGPPSPGA